MMTIRIMSAVRQPVEVVLMYALLLLAYAGLLRRKKAYQARRALMAGTETMLFQPELAARIGINEAIILQKVHEWLEYNKAENSRSHFVDGRWWTYNSYRDWQAKHFPWMKWQTVKAAFRRLEDAGLLTGKALRAGDATKWYTINYDVAAKTGGDSKTTHPHRLTAQGGLKNYPPPTKKLSLTSSESQKKKQRGKQAAPWGGATEDEAAAAGDTAGFDGKARRDGRDDMPPAGGAGEGEEHAGYLYAAWQQLELLVDRGSFDAWMKGAEYRGYSDGLMTIAVRSEYARAACQHRLYRNILRVLGDVCPDVKEIVFVDKSQEAAV